VLDGVTKRYGHLTALRGVCLDVPPGTALTVFGPNGAGKSTLLRLVSSLGKPSVGRVLVAGLDTRRESEGVRARVGLLSHQTLLYDDLSARENLAFYAKMYSLADLPDRIHQSLREVGLQGRASDLVRTFSRGMKQRLAIARATLHRPDVLLFDEPFTGLDAAAKTMLSDRIRALRNNDRTVVIVTHDLERGLLLSDRFVVLVRGRIVDSGPSSGTDLADLAARYEQACANCQLAIGG